MTTRQPTAHYHRSQQQELAPALVLVGGDGQDARAIHGSSRSAMVHPSAFVPNGPMLHHLPNRTDHSYHALRPRRHHCFLSSKADTRNFLIRQCYSKTCINLLVVLFFIRILYTQLRYFSSVIKMYMTYKWHHHV